MSNPSLGEFRQAAAHQFEDQMRKLYYVAKEQGWDIRINYNRHVMWYPPNGGQLINSSLNNVMFDRTLKLLRGSGLKVDHHGNSTIFARPRKPERQVGCAYIAENAVLPTNPSTGNGASIEATVAESGVLKDVGVEVVSTEDSKVPNDGADASGPYVNSPQGSQSQTQEDTMAKGKRRDLTELREAVSKALSSSPGTVKVDQIVEKVSVKFPFADSPMVSKLCNDFIAQGSAEKMGRGLYRWTGKVTKAAAEVRAQAEEPNTEQELERLIDGLLTVVSSLQEWAKKVRKEGEKDRKLRERVRALLGEDE